MKRTLIILAAITIAFSACKEEEEASAFRLAPDTMFRINPDMSAFPANSMLRSGSIHLSALEIVKQASSIAFYSDTIGGAATRMIGDFQRDTVSEIPCLKMWAEDIIVNGKYVPDFIEGRDFIIFKTGKNYVITDTIAYIPNSVIVAARDSIKAAMANNDVESVYRIFNNAFTFRPITGAEWLELKRQGLQ